MANPRKTTRRRKKKDAHEADPERLDECSHTELVQIARMLGHRHASRQLPEDDLIALILGELDHVEDPLEYIRERTHQYVEGNKRIMPSQLSCDLNCPACPHSKVIECFSINHDLVDPDFK